MTDENHIELELKLRRSGRVDFMAEPRLTNVAVLHRVLDGLGLLDPSNLEERLHAAEARVDALELASTPPPLIGGLVSSMDTPVPLSARTEHGEQDDEALVEEIARAAYEEGIEGKWKDVGKDVRRWRIPEARAVLAHLRAQGWGYSAALEEEVRQHSVARAQVRTLTAKAEDLQHYLDVETASRKVLQQKCEEASRRIEASDRLIEEQRQAIAREQQAREAAEATAARFRESYPTWAVGKPVTQEEWTSAVERANRVPALESEVERLKAQVEAGKTLELAKLNLEKAVEMGKADLDAAHGRIKVLEQQLAHRGQAMAVHGS